MYKDILDTIVILELLLGRAPYSSDMNEINEIIEEPAQQSIDLCVSSVTITDTNYLIE